MPDWIAHVLVPWIGGKLFQLKNPKLLQKDIALLMLGGVLPDIVYIGYLLGFAGVDASGALLPFHTITGGLLSAGLISLMFSNRRRSFLLLTAGVAVHFALDSLLLHAGGGMVLLFPFSWAWGFQLGLIQADSWAPAVVAVVISAGIFMALKMRRK
ncbi:MAG: hypothetical protein AB1476_00415 [Candidatus Hadarchaeota archaeon]